MANRQIVDYIKKSEKEGFDSTQIKKVLLKSGFKAPDIEEAFSSYHHSHQMLKISLVVIVALLFLAVALVFIPRLNEAGKSASAEKELSFNDESELLYSVLTSAYDNGVQECDRLTYSVFRDNCIKEYNNYVKTGERSAPPEEKAAPQYDPSSYEGVVARAVKSQDASACNSLEGDSAAKCTEQYYLTMASTTKDISYCDELSEPSQQSDCRLLGAYLK